MVSGVSDITWHSAWVATRRSALYLLGAALFVFLYSVLAAGLGLLPLSDEIRTQLAETGVNWANLSENPLYQLFIHAAAGLLFGALITVFAVLSWPVIAFSGASRRVLKATTTAYVAVVVINLALFTGLVAAG